jgi:hypothetical protein
VGRLTGLLTQPTRICVNLASLPVWSAVSVCRSVRLLAQHGRQTFLRSSTCLRVAAVVGHTAPLVMRFRDWPAAGR